MSLIDEKVNQAIEILKEQDTDLWLTFVVRPAACATLCWTSLLAKTI